MVGCGCDQTSHQAPTTNTHIQYGWYVMAHFLACLLLWVHLLFIRNSYIPPLADMRPVLHHYTEQRGRKNFWAKPTLLDVQICLHFCGNSSQAASFTLPTTHIDKYTKIQIAHRIHAKRSRSIYCNLQCVPSCVVLRLTPTHKNMKHFACLRRRGKRNPLKSPASGIYRSKNSPILHINQKQLRQAKTQNCFIKCRQEVFSDSPTLKIIFLYSHPHAHKLRKREITDMSHG